VLSYRTLKKCEIDKQAVSMANKETDRQTSRELFESEEPDSICPLECQGISYQATQTNHINIKE
jgi:hypothetical protein